MSNNKILFKKTQFLQETWSYIAPTWEEMGQICLDLGVEILENHKKFDTLITLAKGGWTWARTMADILQVYELSSFKLSFYDSSSPGIKLKKPLLEIPLTIPLAKKRVILFEERFKKMDDNQWKKWLYTGVTRAEKELFIFGI